MPFEFHSRPIITFEHRHGDRWQVVMDDERIGPEVSREEAMAAAEWLSEAWDDFTEFISPHWTED